jgi:hypothetical protein
MLTAIRIRTVFMDSRFSVLDITEAMAGLAASGGRERNNVCGLRLPRLRKKQINVIPSEARDLLFHQSKEKNRFLGQTPPSE